MKEIDTYISQNPAFETDIPNETIFCTPSRKFSELSQYFKLDQCQ